MQAITRIKSNSDVVVKHQRTFICQHLDIIGHLISSYHSSESVTFKRRISLDEMLVY